MISHKTNVPLVAQPPTFADLVDRLAFIACGSTTWPNPYAREYHRAIVRRIIGAMTLRDLDTVADMKRKKT
jgi:hypothetical protein